MEPHLEIRRKKDTPFFQPFQLDCKPRPSDVQLAERWIDGESPVDLYQVGTFGACLSSLRSRTIWPTLGNFIAKGAPRYWQASFFNGGTHLSVTYPDEWAQSPLPIETFLHIQTWHTRYPQFHKEYSPELNVTYANVVGLVFTVDTLIRHHWSVDTEWATDYAQVDLIRMFGLYDTMTRLIWTMDYDWRHLPQHCDPDYTHRQLPPGQQCAEPVPKAPRLVQSSEEEAFFSLTESDSSDSTTLQIQEIASDNRILTSLRSATSMICGATNGKTFIEQ